MAPEKGLQAFLAALEVYFQHIPPSISESTY